MFVYYIVHFEMLVKKNLLSRRQGIIAEIWINILVLEKDPEKV